MLCTAIFFVVCGRISLIADHESVTRISKGRDSSHMDHTRAPLYERMLEHLSLQSTSFHVPGHKSGRGLDPIAIDVLEAVMSIDYTELTGLDDLHQPEGVIREAEQLAADCFGADHSFLLVGGSTAGNLATILSMCQQGHDDLFIVQRNVHKSIIHGLMLARARVVFLAPQVDASTGIAAGVLCSDVEEALRQYPNAVGVLLSNPNYYGMGIHLQAIIDCVHATGKPVLVDEAHGAHYGFHPAIPQSALSAGADAVVQSTHKMLTAMTMGAMLHLQGSRLNPQLVRQHLSIVQSSSPSYPILASLDLSRRQLRIQGHSLLNQALEAVKYLHQGLTKMPWYQLVGQTSPAQELKSMQAAPLTRGFTTMDPLKLTVGDRTGTLTGFELQRQLEKHRCYPEMADPHYAVLAFSLVTSLQDIDRLLQALLSISSEFGLDKQALTETTRLIASLGYPPLSEPIAFSPYNNLGNLGNLGRGIHADLDQRCLELPIEEAIGFVARQAIIPYPPGVPILFPGERVSEGAVAQLRQWIESGARIHGLTVHGNIPIF